MKKRKPQPNQFHGRPCIHGHGTLRYRSCGTCVECRHIRWREGADLQRERSARWRARNPDKERARYQRWITINGPRRRSSEA